ncbi:hypothetical protein M422DRAFT_270074 [Sphaerobolus stellatus SS14]|uniref:Uncharacterized protein n=1 Tax=Sphaerobolus stellatus (strain SS14) TaxID=990650 RepID=A0A0C9UIA4_SPHS4|nr:hypothetical protein M422DRAFT_270074 [Sphaerobolus stellatus SS14]
MNIFTLSTLSPLCCKLQLSFTTDCSYATANCQYTDTAFSSHASASSFLALRCVRLHFDAPTSTWNNTRVISAQRLQVHAISLLPLRLPSPPPARPTPRILSRPPTYKSTACTSKLNNSTRSPRNSALSSAVALLLVNCSITHQGTASSYSSSARTIIAGFLRYFIFRFHPHFTQRPRVLYIDTI